MDGQPQMQQPNVRYMTREQQAMEMQRAREDYMRMQRRQEQFQRERI